VAYSNPPPPFDPPPATGGNDGYGWQGQGQASPPPPQQPYQPYQQPYQPYQQYAQPGSYYAGPMAPATNGFAIASLICSILGFIGVLGFGSIMGVIFGHMAIREIDRSNGRQQGRGMAQAGLILGYIGIGIIALFLLFFVVVVIIGIGSAAIAPNG
jgi:hypothetical protein